MDDAALAFGVAALRHPRVGDQHQAPVQVAVDGDKQPVLGEDVHSLRAGTCRLGLTTHNCIASYQLHAAVLSQIDPRFIACTARVLRRSNKLQGRRTFVQVRTCSKPCLWRLSLPSAAPPPELLSPDFWPWRFSVSFLKKKLLQKWHRLRMSSGRCSWIYLYQHDTGTHACCLG